MARSIPFEWLDDPRRRRGALALIRTACLKGWLEGEEHEEARTELVARLAALADEPGLGIRELRGIARTYAAMDRAGIPNPGIPGISGLP